MHSSQNVVAHSVLCSAPFLTVRSANTEEMQELLEKVKVVATAGMTTRSTHRTLLHYVFVFALISIALLCIALLCIALFCIVFALLGIALICIAPRA